MRVRTCAQKNKMGKNIAVNSSTSWVPSIFKQMDLEKAQANGLNSADDQVIFPSTERTPSPPSGFWVMFFDFLLRGLSLPAHEFLHGLLFVGVIPNRYTSDVILNQQAWVAHHGWYGGFAIPGGPVAEASMAVLDAGAYGGSGDRPMADY
jgi:hypothetical protein